MARETFGQIDKLPSGRYRARYTGPDGQLHKAPGTFATKSEARTWLRGPAATIAAGTWVHPDAEKAAQEAAQTAASASATPFGEYAEKWIAERTNSRGEPIRPRTRQEYKRLLAGPLVQWSKTPINTITPDAVRTWRTAEIDRGTLTQTARAYDLLKSILKTAVEDGLISTNPCKVKGGSITRTGRKVEPPTEIELDLIIAAIEDRYKPLVIIAAAGGLRYGEVLALTTDDVIVEHTPDGDVDAVRIAVTKSVTERPGLPRQAGPTKTAAGNRIIAIFGRDAEIIATYVATRDGLLWTSSTGGYVPQSSVNNAWRKARAAAGREDLPFHGLRHYAGTRYAQHGATLAEIMAQLGHSSVKAAMGYQHAARERADEIGRRAAR